jgi:ATP-binding cassette subfamily F protein uup
MTVIDAVKKIAENVTLGDGTVLSITQFMNYFLFPPEKQYTFIKKLSGGEKRRLYLLTVLMQNPNFLILDEPTNDLDILTLNILEEYLAGFRGCLIIVSHDRFFMDKVVDHIFEFQGEGVIKDFAGNYTQMRIKREEERISAEVKTKKTTDSPAGVRPSVTRERKQGLSFREKRELESLENEIRELENEKRLIESVMNGGNLKPEELYIKSERLGKLLATLDEKEMRWLDLSEK